MTKRAVIKRLEQMSDSQFALIEPYIEADLESIDSLEELRREIEAGRRSARDEPVLDAQTVYARVRAALVK